jgi:hypothetical protein
MATRRALGVLGVVCFAMLFVVSVRSPPHLSATATVQRTGSTRLQVLSPTALAAEADFAGKFSAHDGAFRRSFVQSFLSNF